MHCALSMLLSTVGLALLRLMALWLSSLLMLHLRLALRLIASLWLLLFICLLPALFSLSISSVSVLV